MVHLAVVAVTRLRRLCRGGGRVISARNARASNRILREKIRRKDLDGFHFTLPYDVRVADVNYGGHA